MTRQIEIRNDGEFEFQFKCYDVQAETDRLEAELAEAKAASEGVEGDETPLRLLLKDRESKQRAWDANLVAEEDVPDPQSLVETGAFSITGAGGTVAPGQTATLNLTFNAEGAELFRAPLRIDISGRAGSNATGKSMEIVGESVIPGIETRVFESIFEEQAVVGNLQPVGVGESKDGDDSGSHQRVSMYAEQQGTFSFGAVVPSQAPKLGIAERFKITNPNKIKAMVSFDVTMRGLDEGKDASNGAAFQVQPASLELPPHEHRYVTVYFKPVEMRSYDARFAATVADGTDERTNRLAFELTGEGTLPCVTVEQPTQLAEDGSLLMEFPRTRVGKNNSSPIVLRNGGTVPVSVYFTMEVLGAFSFDGRGRTITLPPKASERLNVTFSPSTVCPSGDEGDAGANVWQGELRINTAQNEYGMTRVTLRGAAYADDIAFENLPGGKSDEIDFGELPVVPGQSVSNVVSFCLENHRTDRSVRFEMPEHEDFTFTPAVGHLMPRGKIDVIATFKPAVFKAAEAEDQAAEAEAVAVAAGGEGGGVSRVGWLAQNFGDP